MAQREEQIERSRKVKARQNDTRCNAQANQQSVFSAAIGPSEYPEGSGSPATYGGVAVGAAGAQPQPQPSVCRRNLQSNPHVAKKMLAVFKERMWERVADLNSQANGMPVISIRAEPKVREKTSEPADPGGGTRINHLPQKRSRGSCQRGP